MAVPFSTTGLIMDLSIIIQKPKNQSRTSNQELNKKIRMFLVTTNISINVDSIGYST